MPDSKESWTPVCSADLRGLTPKTFEELQKDFYLAVKSRAPEELGQHISTGWHNITPRIAEMALLGRVNRKIAIADVQHYGRQMVDGLWKSTGETICIDESGTMTQGYHRMWACYLSGAAFRTFVVSGVEMIPDLFAYYDAGRKRSNVDALQTAGLNGVSATIDAVIKISVRYDLDLFNNKRGPKAPRMTQFEVLEYVRAHPELREIIADTVSEYKTLLKDLFGRKQDVACFAACRIVKAHGKDVFEDFMSALDDEAIRHGAVYLLRQKLERDIAGMSNLSKPDVLAFVIKAFNAWHAGKAMKKLTWSTDEAMPAFDEPEDDDDEAETRAAAAE